jgi:predicted nucleic acid-binding protein
MAANVLADAGFLVALLSRRDAHHRWAAAQARQFEPPWHTCEAALSEGFHLLGGEGGAALGALLHRQAVVVSFDLGDNLDAVLKFIGKYREVPASLADACLVRMTETLDDPIVLTTDGHFGIYRRHGRQVVSCVRP